jgi:iron(III) transport system ATP-binding protein
VKTGPATQTPGARPYLELQGISKTFRDGRGNPVPAVQDFSLDIARGEFVTLIGPSGCGKTTTLRIIAGIEEPDRGRVFLDGIPLDGASPQQRNMPMVFQSYALFPHMTVFENVAYGLRLRGMTADAIAHDVALASQMVDLAGVEHRYPGELSGGQQQRVALARALVLKPQIILFDEPLSNLDPRLRTQTRAAIRRVQQLLGITIVYVTHDQAEALSLSDRVVIMHRGRIVQHASPREIYHAPASPFVADFIGSANFLDGVVLAANRTAVTIRVLGNEYRVPASCAPAGLAPGQEVLVAVRPEAVILERETDTGTDRADTPFAPEGTVETVAFAGPLTEYTVGCGDGWIVVLRPEGSGAGAREPLFVGDRVRLRFSPETFRLYEATQ